MKNEFFVFCFILEPIGWIEFLDLKIDGYLFKDSKFRLSNQNSFLAEMVGVFPYSK